MLASSLTSRYARVAHQAGGLQQAYVLAARDLRGRGGRPVQQIGGQVAAVQKAQQTVGRGNMRVDGAVGVPVPLHFCDPCRQRARPDLAALPHKFPQPLQRRRIGFERLGGEAAGVLLGKKIMYGCVGQRNAQYSIGTIFFHECDDVWGNLRDNAF